MAFKKPILFLIFNRPDTTQRVFEAIRLIKPEKLFVAADGPRSDKLDEGILCQRTRAIIQQVDWACEVETLFRENNLGCKKAVSEAINWFFDKVDEGLILEDDCLPSPSFFNYCAELLDKYREDQRILMISGDNFQDGKIRGKSTYYFSRIAHIWGWASWRRAWQLYDFDLTSLDSFIAEKQLDNIFPEKEIQEYWLDRLQGVKSGKINTWDYQWAYTLLAHNGYSIMPNMNLISNIGFGDNSTHTSNKNNPLANMPTFELGDMIHPSFVIADTAADYYTFRNHYGLKPRRSIYDLIKHISNSWK